MKINFENIFKNACLVLIAVLLLIHQLNNKTMTTQELTTAKANYSQMAAIYNSNMKAIKLQLNRQALATLKLEYNVTEDSHLAKILMLKGIKL